MTRLAFAPVIPLSLLTALAVIAVLITAYAFFMRARGAWARGLAFAVLLFALSGPLLVREKHAPLPDVAVIVTDRSQSMSLGQRAVPNPSRRGRDGGRGFIVKERLARGNQRLRHRLLGQDGEKLLVTVAVEPVVDDAQADLSCPLFEIVPVIGLSQIKAAWSPRATRASSTAGSWPPPSVWPEPGCSVLPGDVSMGYS